MRLCTIRLPRLVDGVSHWPHMPWVAPGRPGNAPWSSKPQPQPMAMPDHGTSLMSLWLTVVRAVKPT